MRRRIWILIALLAGFIGVLVVVNHQVRADFDYYPTLLSYQYEACDAVEPRSAISADKQWLAVVWIQGMMDDRPVCKTSGRVVLRAATEGDALQDWKPRVDVFEGSPTGACAIHADIALDGTTAHLVTSIRQPCYTDFSTTPQTTTLFYRTCDVAAGSIADSCSVSETVYSLTASDVEAARFNDVRITVDDAGTPHVAYSTATFNGQTGIIWYLRRSEGAWNAMEPVQISAKIIGDAGEKHAAYRPRIAWSSFEGAGRVHILWETHQEEVQETPFSFDGNVWYRSCSDTEATCGSRSNLGGTRGGLDFGSIEATHPSPALVAKDGNVVVLWNKCREYNGNNPCEGFVLMYRRSVDNGETFALEREALSDRENPVRSYDGTDFYGESGSAPEYEKFTRPAIALDDNGYPHIAWQVHEDLGGSVSAYYVHTNIVTDTLGDIGYYWMDENWTTGVISYNTYTYIMPDIQVPDLDAGQHGMHLFYMQDDRAVNSPYRIYYDYLGDARLPDPEPTPTICGGENLDCYVYLPTLNRGR